MPGINERQQAHSLVMKMDKKTNNYSSKCYNRIYYYIQNVIIEEHSDYYNKGKQLDKNRTHKIFSTFKISHVWTLR